MNKDKLKVILWFVGALIAACLTILWLAKGKMLLCVLWAILTALTYINSYQELKEYKRKVR